MDDVFRALADPGRRALLDALFAHDGRTLQELCEVLPGLTRFGVMKHLAVLEDAHLVTTRRVGRTKQHFLNPVPIREIHDRWVSKFAEPWVSAMVDLRRTLEAEPLRNEPPTGVPVTTEPLATEPLTTRTDQEPVR